MSDWTNGTANGDETEDRTSKITANLKVIYNKCVLPCEKRYRYDYFYESPLLSDVEFDGMSIKVIINTHRERERQTWQTLRTD